jgi:hypothetical protein
MAQAFKRYLSRSIGTGATDVGAYTVAANTQVTCIGLTLGNRTASTVEVDASVYDGANETFLVVNAPVPAGGSLVVIGGDQKVVLEPGDSIRVTSNAASSIDAVLSVLELT